LFFIFIIIFTYIISKDKIIDHYGLMKFHLEYEDQTVPAIIDIQANERILTRENFEKN